jgi:cell division protease FtsH
MTLTDEELTDPTAELTGGDDARRRPISDVDAWLDGLDSDVRRALRATRRAAGRRRRARNR